MHKADLHVVPEDRRCQLSLIGDHVAGDALGSKKREEEAQSVAALGSELCGLPKARTFPDNHKEARLKAMFLSAMALLSSIYS